MEHRDKLSEHYEPILQGSYDCVDRIVVNAFCPLLLSPGGLRYWYRLLRGEDQTLDNNSLMRMAGRFSRRVQSYAKSKNIPLQYFKSGERKHEEAEGLIPQDKNFEGIFAIFVARATAMLWDVKRFSSGKMDIRRKTEPSYINHYYFHIMDKDWGHICVRISAHPPFSAMVMLNGHEWVERRAAFPSLHVQKEGNCFTDYSDGEALSRLADTLQKGRLDAVCDRWMPQCLWFALDYPEQQQSQFRYQYSIYQVEYSRNLLFQRGRFLDQVYQGIIDLTRSRLDIPRLRTIFGQKNRPYKHAGTRASRSSAPEVRIETPDYNLTIFKIHFGKLTVKLYDKGERTLRAEVVVHDAKALKCKRSVGNFPAIVKQLQAMMNSFLDNLLYLHVAMIDQVDLSALAAPAQKGARRLAGVNLAQPRMQHVLQAALALSVKPAAYAASDLAQRMQYMGWEQYSPRNAAYDLQKLRAKELVEKKGARAYANTAHGIQTIVALLSLTQKQVPQTLAILRKDESLSAKELSLLEQRYFNIKNEVVALRAIYGIHANAA